MFPHLAATIRGLKHTGAYGFEVSSGRFSRRRPGKASG
jgi:hypothetical protein